MRPSPDPTDTPPPPAEAERVADRLARLRTRLLDPTDAFVLGRFGLAVLDQFELKQVPQPVTVNPHSTLDGLESIGRRFIEWVVPDAEEVRVLAPAAFAEYAACDSDAPDPGRLAAAYGTARLRLFHADRRLTFRTGGYRGRPGALLTDHLLAVVLDRPPPAVSPPEQHAAPTRPVERPVERRGLAVALATLLGLVSGRRRS